MKKIFVLLLLIILPIKVHAESIIAMDMDSKRIMHSKNINEVRSIASISKIMTAILALESNKLDDIVTIGDEVDKSYGSSIYIEKGEQITLRDLVYGLMLRSGNDASYAIANYISNDFISLMNQKAKAIGMMSTTFNNPNGLDEKDGNYSTAYDMALLTSYAMKNSEYKKIVSTKKYIVKTNKKTYIWFNKNKLLFNYKYTTGGKTGYTHKAGRTLVTTASKDNMNVVIVTLDTSNDFTVHENMYKLLFDKYRKKKILSKGNLNLYTKIYKNYNLSIDNDYEYALKDNDKVLLKYYLNDLPKNGTVGKVSVYVNDTYVYKVNISAKKKKYTW